jgi:predicted RNase H-like HicB family nuclease
MNFAIEFEQEDDGRWIAEIPSLPGVMAYGITKWDVESKVEVMALRVVADRIERENSTMTDLYLAAA